MHRQVNVANALAAETTAQSTQLAQSTLDFRVQFDVIAYVDVILFSVFLLQVHGAYRFIFFFATPVLWICVNEYDVFFLRFFYHSSFFPLSFASYSKPSL